MIINNKSVQLMWKNYTLKSTPHPINLEKHNYRGEWNSLDHIYVSKGWNEGPLFAHEEDGTILTLEYLLSTYKEILFPLEHLEEQISGRFSDHLPVYIDLQYK